MASSRNRKGAEAKGWNQAAEKKIRKTKKGPLQVVRSQAARILKTVIDGAANRRATASIKSLIYQPSVRNKKATMALTCQCLRYLPVIKEVIENSKLLGAKIKVQRELLYVMTYELLFGKELIASGGAEDIVLSWKSSLRAALARLLVRKNVQHAQDLLPPESDNGCADGRRYVRVNTLKVEVEEAIRTLRESLEVEEDDMIPGLLSVPFRTDLHSHPLVTSGELILQGKASCMPALALAPDPGWVVLDACAAPGNKTVQLAALMEGKGKVLACEVDKHRIQRLYEIVELAGASNVEILHQDFLEIDPSSSVFSNVKAILLDPSCSGSGTGHRRLDHYLSSISGEDENEALQRLERLACFQERVLRFALSFPSVERVVYSTCSIHQRENEDVIKMVLDFAKSNNFQLGFPFPKWEHRGLPVFEGSNRLLRVEPSKDMDGFFVALFERESSNAAATFESSNSSKPKKQSKGQLEQLHCSIIKRKRKKHKKRPG